MKHLALMELQPRWFHDSTNGQSIDQLTTFSTAQTARPTNDLIFHVYNEREDARRRLGLEPKGRGNQNQNWETTLIQRFVLLLYIFHTFAFIALICPSCPFRLTGRVSA